MTKFKDLKKKKIPKILEARRNYSPKEQNRESINIFGKFNIANTYQASQILSPQLHIFRKYICIFLSPFIIKVKSEELHFLCLHSM